MIRPTDQSINRLPKWARQYVSYLEQKVSAHEDYTNNQVDESTKVRYLDVVQNVQYRIPEHATVQFHTDFGVVDANLDHHNRLWIRTMSRMAVIPWAANSISIENSE